MWVGKCAICIGLTTALFFVLGAALFGCSWFIQDEIKQFVHDGIRDQIIIDSKDSPGFKAWSNNYDDHAPLFFEIYMYNVTNVEELQNGGEFINVTLVGPYMYWCKKLLFDIDFPNDGNEVSYRTWKRYDFLPERSCPTCKETDVLVNLNPAYIGALSQTDGELQLDLALTGPITKRDVFGFLWGPFTQDVATQHRTTIISNAKNAIIANMTGPNPEDVFYAIWANATQQISPLWNGMLVSSWAGVSSNITLSSAKALFNASIPFSLLDASLGSAKLWRRAFNDSQAFGQLASTFELTPGQLWSVMNWLNLSCNPTLVYPSLIETYGLVELRDLAFLQWGQATVTNRVSVKTLYPEENFSFTYEFCLFFLDFVSMDLNTSKLLLEGPWGLFDAPNLRLYTEALSALNFTLIKERWGLDLGQVAETGTYFLFLNGELAAPFLKNALAQGNGLFTNRTVHQWLWDVTDPIIELLSPEQAQAALIVNQTTIDQSRKMQQPNLCRTGKNNWDQIGDFIQFDGQTVIEDVYAVPLPVTGKNDLGVFIPNLNKSVIIHNFDDNYIRDVTLLPIRYIEVKGVRALRYEVTNTTWTPNSTLFQEIQGFANLTGYHNGSTIFLSNPHMYLCNKTYVNKISPIQLNNTLDVIRVDIEPHTGSVIQYRQGLQVNMYLDPKNSGWLNVYNTKVKSDLFYPIAIISEFSTLREKDADAIKTLYLGLLLEDVLFWVALGVGIGLMVLSVPAAALFIWKARKDSSAHHGYAPLSSPAINTE